MKQIKYKGILFLLAALLSVCMWTGCGKSVNTPQHETVSESTFNYENTGSSEAREFSAGTAAPENTADNSAAEVYQAEAPSAQPADTAAAESSAAPQSAAASDSLRQAAAAQTDNSDTKREASAAADNSAEAAHLAEAENVCTLLIDCNTALRSGRLSDSLMRILPDNGIIFYGNIEFTPGDTIFDVLNKAARDNGIPLEFSSSPGYGSKYIEGINSLYEFDCGELSGWVYYVNGSRLNYGCDRRAVQKGDDIRWYYTCSLGDDIQI